MKQAKQIFTTIFNDNQWNNEETISGIGSTIENAKLAVKAINEIIKKHKIKTIVDVGCGDTNWLSGLNLKGVHYIGVDIVDHIVDANNKKFKDMKDIEFISLDEIEKVEKADLIICRDVFGHLSFDDGISLLNKILSIKPTYLLLTTFPAAELNYDIHTGDWYPVNMELKPFDFEFIWTIKTFDDSFEGKKLVLYKN